MVTKKIRTEYMKKFKDPRWDTFSKCYEDSLKYRLTRRVMEHSHKPWIYEGWDSCSESSGWSTPRLTRNKVAPLSLPPPPPLPTIPTSQEEDKRTSIGCKAPAEDREHDAVVGDGASNPVLENGVNEPSVGSVKAAPLNGRPTDITTTDNGPADTVSSDGEPLKNPPVKKRHRRQRTPRSEPAHGDSSQDEKPPVERKPPRAKSQPPISSKELRRPSSRLDWTERHTEVQRTTQNDSNTSDACCQTRRQSDKRSSNPERRRAHSADLEKLRMSQLSVVDDRWTTEYMRCFSARLR